MTSLLENPNASSGLSLSVRLKEGSAGAWSDLVELYGPLGAGWAAAAGLNRAAQEDIVQEVFLAVHRSIARFEPAQQGATFRGWLWRIARNAVLQSLRKSQPQACGGSTAAVQLASVADPWPDASELLPPASASDTTALLRRAMQQIESQVEPQTWAAFWNTTVLGQSTADVAEQLGVTAAVVRKAKSRTLQRLRKQLGDLA